MQLEAYQHIPEYIDPIIFQIGFFSVKWYSLGYLVSFIVIYCLLRFRVNRGEFNISKFPNSKSQFPNKSQTQNSKFIFDLMIYLIIGLLIGARLGYVIFYDPNYFIHNPLEIFLPFQVSSCGLQITGIYGMSYFGGLTGTIVAGLIFRKRYKINFWQLSDLIIPAVPAGYFFGRIGNFLNGELYGRVTDVPWGMHFPADPEKLLRHPSQLYEAFFEGTVLFLILWIFKNKSIFKGQMLSVYLMSYGFFRFFIEFFREPDTQIGLYFDWLTLGQVFSAAVMAIAMLVFINKKISRRNAL